MLDGWLLNKAVVVFGVPKLKPIPADDAGVPNKVEPCPGVPNMGVVFKLLVGDVKVNPALVLFGKEVPNAGLKLDWLVGLVKLKDGDPNIDGVVVVGVENWKPPAAVRDPIAELNWGMADAFVLGVPVCNPLYWGGAPNTVVCPKAGVSLGLK